MPKNTNYVCDFRTLRRHCQAGVKLGLSEDYQQLVVKKVETVHNHEVSEVSNFLVS